MKTELWPVPIQRLPFMVRNGVPPTLASRKELPSLSDERAVRARRAPDEDAVAGQRAVAAVRRGGEQVVEAVLVDDVAPLVAVADGDLVSSVVASVAAVTPVSVKTRR
jgi:hypothetical protein